MKRRLTIFIALCLSVCMLATCGAANSQSTEESTAETYEDLFQKDNVIDIDIDIASEDWQSMCDNPELQEFKSADVTVDGIKVENVGVRTKGNSSLNSGKGTGRYSLKIKLDKYEKKQTLLGLDEFVVNNMFADPSYLREYLSYEAMKEIGLASSLTSFANIYINGELLGTYLCVESVDNSFLERNFGNDDGTLYKAEMNSSLVYEEGSDYATLETKIGDETDRSGLEHMIQVLNEMPDGEKGDIESVLDVDSALKYIAINTVLGNYDSYNGNMLQNYYLYEQEGKMTVIPWDYNMSFGGYQGSGSSAKTIPIDEPVFNVSMEKTPMITNLLEVEEYKERYYSYIQELLNYLEGFEERVSGLAELLKPYVEADPTKFTTLEKFEAAVTYNENEESEGEMPGATGGQPPQTDGQMTPPDGQQGGNTPGNMQGGNPPQQPDGNAGQRMEPPQKPEDGAMPPDMPQPDENGQQTPQFDGGRGQGGRGAGGMGGGGMTANGSIVNFIRDRVENIQKQFSGELEKTGNTTMNNSGMGGGRGPGGDRGQRGQTQKISVVLNGSEVQFDQSPVIENSRTMVPFRAIFEALGASIEWDETTKTVTAQKDGTVITLTIDSDYAYQNGEAVELDAPAKIIGDRTLVPVRFVAESLGLSVGWDETTRTVTLS